MDDNVREALAGVADIPDTGGDDITLGELIGMKNRLERALAKDRKTATVKCRCCGRTLSLDVISDSGIAKASAALKQGWVCCPSPDSPVGDEYWCPECEEEQTLAKLMGLEDYDGSIARLVMMELDSFGMDSARKLMELMLEKLDEKHVCNWLDKKDTRITFKAALSMRPVYAESEEYKAICEGTLMRLLGKVAADALVDMAEDAVAEEKEGEE